MPHAQAEALEALKAPSSAPMTREGGGGVLFWEGLEILLFFVVFILSKQRSLEKGAEEGEGRGETNGKHSFRIIRVLEQHSSVTGLLLYPDSPCQLLS